MGTARLLWLDDVPSLSSVLGSPLLLLGERRLAAGETSRTGVLVALERWLFASWNQARSQGRKEGKGHCRSYLSFTEEKQRLSRGPPEAIPNVSFGTTVPGTAALPASVEPGMGGGGWERQRGRHGDSQHLSLEQLTSTETVTLLSRTPPPPHYRILTGSRQ